MAYRTDLVDVDRYSFDVGDSNAQSPYLLGIRGRVRHRSDGAPGERRFPALGSQQVNWHLGRLVSTQATAIPR